MQDKPFKKDYRSGFDYLTNYLKGLSFMQGIEMKEIVMPDGEIQRWFMMNGEEIILRYANHNPKP